MNAQKHRDRIYARIGNLEAEVAALKKPSGGISKETVEQVLGGPTLPGETEATTLHELEKALRGHNGIQADLIEALEGKLARVTEERDLHKSWQHALSKKYEPQCFPLTPEGAPGTFTEVPMTPEEYVAEHQRLYPGMWEFRPTKEYPRSAPTFGVPKTRHLVRMEAHRAIKKGEKVQPESNSIEDGVFRKTTDFRKPANRHEPYVYLYADEDAHEAGCIARFEQVSIPGEPYSMDPALSALFREMLSYLDRRTLLLLAAFRAQYGNASTYAKAKSRLLDLIQRAEKAMEGEDEAK